MSKVGRAPDILLASIVVVASFAVTVCAYAAARRAEMRAVVIIPSISPTPTRYSLTSKNSCVGSFKTLVTEDAVIVVSVGGTFRAQLHSLPLNVTFSSDWFFNPLNQLSTGELRISEGERSVHLRTSGAHPINLSIEGAGVALPPMDAIRLNGPILLGRNQDRSLRIERIVDRKSTIVPPLFVNTLEEQLSIRAVEAGSEGDPCTTDPDGRADLTPLVRTATLLSSSIMQQMPNALKGLVPND